MKYLSNLEALHNHFKVIQPVPASLIQLDHVLDRDVDVECDQVLSLDEVETINGTKGVMFGAYDKHILVIPEMGEMFPTVVAHYTMYNGTLMALNVYRMYISSEMNLGVLSIFELDNQLNVWLGAVYNKLKEGETDE